MVYLPTKAFIYKVPKWTPPKLLLQNEDFEENPGGKVDPCPQEDLREGSFLEKEFVFKNDT